jgi:hypothetical protein
MGNGRRQLKTLPGCVPWRAMRKSAPDGPMPSAEIALCGTQLAPPLPGGAFFCGLAARDACHIGLRFRPLKAKSMPTLSL